MLKTKMKTRNIFLKPNKSFFLFVGAMLCERSTTTRTLDIQPINGQKYFQLFLLNFFYYNT